MPETEFLTKAAPSESAEDRARKSQARARFNKAMKLVRRVHLYAGLFMTPWVFLYGMTALLFNHPKAFPDRVFRTISPEDLAGTPLATFPSPRDLADRVVTAINAGEEAQTPTAAYHLVRPSEAAFSRDYFTTLTGDGQEISVRLDLASRSGSVRVAPKREEAKPKERAPFARKDGLKLDPSPMETATQSLPTVLSRLGMRVDPPQTTNRPERARRAASEPTPKEATAATARPSGPELSFLMEGRGKTWRVSYNLQTGALSGRPAEVAPSEPLSTRRFLTRLHVAHGYPSRFDARWAWAVAVDLMFASMVGWGVTGLLMWWQMKNLRRIGVVVLILSVLTAIAMAVGMHAALSTSL